MGPWAESARRWWNLIISHVSRINIWLGSDLRCRYQTACEHLVQAPERCWSCRLDCQRQTLDFRASECRNHGSIRGSGDPLRFWQHGAVLEGDRIPAISSHGIDLLNYASKRGSSRYVPPQVE